MTDRYEITTVPIPGGHQHCIHKVGREWDREVYAHSLVDALFACKMLNSVDEETRARCRDEAIYEAARILEDAA